MKTDRMCHRQTRSKTRRETDRMRLEAVTETVRYRERQTYRETKAGR